MLVLFVNVRRFALEIRNGFSDGYFSKLLKAKSLAAAASSRSGSPSPFISGESTLTAQTKDLIPQLSLNTSDLTNSDQVFDDSTLSPGIDTSVTGLNHETVIGISSALMLWGVDSEIEKVCRDIFGIKPCLPYVSAGLRG